MKTEPSPEEILEMLAAFEIDNPESVKIKYVREEMDYLADLAFSRMTEDGR